MHVKICGITSKEDALHAVSCGASHIGVIFASGSPRIVEAAAAAEISEAIGEKAVLVGVFQNQDLGYVVQIAKEARLGAIQLHGQESVEYCTVLRQMLDLPIIKVINLDLRSDAGLNQSIELYQKLASQKIIDHLLFDKPKGLKDADNWLGDALVTVAALNAKYDLPPFFFAGGLHPGNLDTVPKSLGASGYDVASGVEKSPGKKDPELVQKFIEHVKGRQK